MGVKKTVTRENAKNQENKNNSIGELTPQGERLAYWSWPSISNQASAGTSATAAGLPLVRGRGAATSQRPSHLGLSPATRL